MGHNALAASSRVLVLALVTACGGAACSSSGGGSDERDLVDRDAPATGTSPSGARMDADRPSSQAPDRAPAPSRTPATPDPDSVRTPPVAGAPAEQPMDATAGAISVPPPTTLGNGDDNGAPRTTPMVNACDAPGAFGPLLPDAGETCWLFAAHGVSAPGDTSRFDVPIGESYSQFYFDVPWPAGSLASRFGAQLDNASVLRHGLLFSSKSPLPNGTVARNVTGTTIGEDTELLALWTPGSCITRYPDDFGGKLPDSGKLMVQWHHYNDTSEVQPNGAAMVLCTVPAGSRPHVGGLTILGTENLRIGPGVRAFSSECANESGEAITLIGFQPHMRALGMRSVHMDVDRSGAGVTIFDQPFAVDDQVHYLYDGPQRLAPGRILTTSCVYQNDTGQDVGFGQSAHQETCFQIAFAYPYGALNNGVPSLLGATNTCW